MGADAMAMRVGATALLVGGVVTAAQFLWWRLKARRGTKESDAKNAAVGGGAAKSAEAADEDPEKGVYFYFGSQSGTAEGFAKQLGEAAEERGISAKVVDFEDFEPEVFTRHSVVVLLVATYGEGDPTDNAVEFYKWVQDQDLPSSTLEGMKFAVMGLGNRQYIHFNQAGKVADAHLERLGGARICERGEGDDEGDIEEDFEKWCEGALWPALEAAALPDSGEGFRRNSSGGGPMTAQDLAAKLPLRATLLRKGETPPTDPMVQAGGVDVLGKWYFSAYEVPVVVCDELRQKPDLTAGLTTKHIDVDISGCPALRWQTADNLEVLPTNPPEEVEWFAQRLGVADRLDDDVAFVRAAGTDRVVRKPFPTPCSLRKALGLYCDLGVAPPRALAKKFAVLVSNSEERAALEHICDDHHSFSQLTSEEVSLNLREFFEIYMPSAEIDVSAFLQLCARQKYRPYTIASSSREDKQRIGLCVGLVQHDLAPVAPVLEKLAENGHPLPPGALERLRAAPRRVFRGTCSNMLCTSVEVGQRLWVSARASTFRLPRQKSAPIVMIGAGTGIAPFRGFVREFRAEGGVRPNTTLFFGCRKKEEDFIYRDELLEATTSDPPALGELVTAFSRDQAEKVYVQNKIRESKDRISELLANGAYFYVCGLTSMGAAIREELTPLAGGKVALDRLQKDGRYVEELWAA